jgi:hypothetical protein
VFIFSWIGLKFWGASECRLVAGNCLNVDKRTVPLAVFADSAGRCRWPVKSSVTDFLHNFEHPLVLEASIEALSVILLQTCQPGRLGWKFLKARWQSVEADRLETLAVV